MSRVAKLYHKRKEETDPPVPAQELLATIQRFVDACGNPAVLEFGEDLIPLTEGSHTLEIREERLWLELWHEDRTISRRLLTVEKSTPNALECAVHRFGGRAGKLTFLDLSRPQAAHKTLSGARQSFAEQFRRMLFRQFPGWNITALTSSMDLRRSLSPVYPRARLVRGNQQIAAIACPANQEEPALLTFALIWFDHIRCRAKEKMHTKLCIFVPDSAGSLTAHRLKWLNQDALNARIFRFNSHGSAGEVDVHDLGNLETRVNGPGGHGYENAGFSSENVTLQGSSERALETAIRSSVGLIDEGLRPVPVHEQVLTFAAGTRNSIDLLAAFASGRLAILELKVSDDIHLPIQALDYWTRIRWHLERGELQHLFPGLELSPGALPKLFLIAPALAFHSSNTTVLRYFSPEIEIERVGVNMHWQQNLKVVLRLAGAEAPIYHRSSE